MKESNSFNDIFYPRSVAVVGASRSPNKLGYQTVMSLHTAGFEGRVYPINPRASEVLGYKAYPSLLDVPGEVDLVVVAIPGRGVLEAVEECAEKGVKGVIILASGFREIGGEGAELESRIVETCNRAGIKIIGPNCLGIMNSHAKLNASFSPIGPLKKGSISLISQSGGAGMLLLYHLFDERLGFSKFITVGNRANVEIADLLLYLKDDEETRVICVFMEGVDKARELLEAAKETSKVKPVLCYKAGKTERAAKLAPSHTGSLAGSYTLYKAAFKQAGILEVDGSSELIDAAKALSMLPPPRSGGVAVLTHTAGPSIIATETLEKEEAPLASLSERTKERISSQFPFPVYLQNPCDITGIGYAYPQIYAAASRAILEDPDVSVFIPIFTPSFQPEMQFPYREIIDAAKETGKAVVAALLAPTLLWPEERSRLEEAGIPVYSTPDRAAKAAANYLKYWKLRRKLEQQGG